MTENQFASNAEKSANIGASNQPMITLDVEAECSEGYTQPTIRAVNENCKTLHVKTFEFED